MSDQKSIPDRSARTTVGSEYGPRIRGPVGARGRGDDAARYSAPVEPRGVSQPPPATTPVWGHPEQPGPGHRGASHRRRDRHGVGELLGVRTTTLVFCAAHRDIKKHAHSHTLTHTHTHTQHAHTRTQTHTHTHVSHTHTHTHTHTQTHDQYAPQGQGKAAQGAR